MSSPTNTDVALEADYLQMVTQMRLDGHLDSDDRLMPREMSSATHVHVLRAIHEQWSADKSRDRLRLATALDENGQRLASEFVSNLSALPIGLKHLDLTGVTTRLRTLAQRRTRRAHMMHAVAAFDAGDDESANEHVLSVGTVERQGIEVITAHETVHRAMTNLFQSNSRDRGRLGFPAVDDALGGLPDRTMLVVGGTTGSGKSSVALAIAMNWARQHNHKVGIISVEDSEEVYGPRVLTHVCDVNSEGFFGGDISRGYIDECNRGLEAAKQVGIHFGFALNRPLDEVLSAIRKAVRQHGCRKIILDYLQAVMLDPKMPRAIGVARAAQAIKAECQALGVPLVLLSQLSRPEKAKPFSEPHMNDLKESGDLENMAEAIMLLWKVSDEDNAATWGKVAKVKWSPKRPRFSIERSPTTGCVTALPFRAKPEQANEPNGRPMFAQGANRY